MNNTNHFPRTKFVKRIINFKQANVTNCMIKLVKVVMVSSVMSYSYHHPQSLSARAKSIFFLTLPLSVSDQFTGRQTNISMVPTKLLPVTPFSLTHIENINTWLISVNKSSHTNGMIPFSSRVPIIVCVLPEDVWP